MDGCPTRPLLSWLARLIEAMQHKDLRLHSLATREAQQTIVSYHNPSKAERFWEKSHNLKKLLNTSTSWAFQWHELHIHVSCERGKEKPRMVESGGEAKR